MTNNDKTKQRPAIQKPKAPPPAPPSTDDEEVVPESEDPVDRANRSADRGGQGITGGFERDGQHPFER